MGVPHPGCLIWMFCHDSAGSDRNDRFDSPRAFHGKEPVVVPVLSTTADEVLQAMHDYQAGRFA